MTFKHSEEAKQKISKNNAKYWKGREFSDEHKARIGEASRGRKLSEEQKRKISESNKGKHGHLKGIKRTEEFRRIQSEIHKGDKSHFWKGGIANQNKVARSTIEIELWRESVFERDNWTCVECGAKGVILNAHHIKPFALFPELRTAIDNGVTLCEICHKLLHNLTKKQK